MSNVEIKNSNESSDSITFECGNVYEVEYEPESEIDLEVDQETGKRRNRDVENSDSDSELDDDMVVTSAIIVLDALNDSNWADSSDTEATDSGIEAPAATSSNAESQVPTEQGSSGNESVTDAEPLKCIGCKAVICLKKPNVRVPPVMRECHNCWQVRNLACVLSQLRNWITNNIF